MSETDGRGRLVYFILAVAALVAFAYVYRTIANDSAPVSPINKASSEAMVMAHETNNSTESSASLLNTTDAQQTITVAGMGSINLPPDMVSINMGIDTVATSAAEAVQNNAQAMNKIVEALKALGLNEEEVRTSCFSVYPQYQYDLQGENPPKISGYQASNNVNVMTDNTDDAANIIDGAISAGANRVDGPWFFLSPDAQKTLRADLIEDAIQDARERAESLLNTQGLTIKGIKNISMNEGSYPVTFLEGVVPSRYDIPFPYGQTQLMQTFLSPPRVLPGEQQVSLTVVVTYTVG